MCSYHSYLHVIMIKMDEIGNKISMIQYYQSTETKSIITKIKLEIKGSFLTSFFQQLHK